MKHWSMIKMNYALVALTYIVCAIFYYKTLDIVAPADVYPRMLLAFMFILGTLLLISTVRASRKVHANEDKISEVEYPWGSINNKRVWVAILGTALYLVCMVYIGFYVTTFVYIVALMYWYSDTKDAKTLGKIFLASVVITVIV